MFYFFLEVCLKHSSADLLLRGVGPPFFDKKIKVLLGDDLDLSLS